MTYASPYTTDTTIMHIFNYQIPKVTTNSGVALLFFHLIKNVCNYVGTPTIHTRPYRNY